MSEQVVGRGSEGGHPHGDGDEGGDQGWWRHTCITRREFAGSKVSNSATDSRVDQPERLSPDTTYRTHNLITECGIHCKLEPEVKLQNTKRQSKAHAPDMRTTGILPQ